MTYDQQIQKMGEDLQALIEANAHLPSYEICYRLIATSMNLLLKEAPSQLVAMQTMLAAIEIGIAEYKEDCNGGL